MAACNGNGVFSQTDGIIVYEMTKKDFQLEKKT